MSTSDRPPQTSEEQQADVLRAIGDKGFEVQPAPDPDQTRAALDRLLDGRPQLAALALSLVQAVVGSGIIPAPETRVMTSSEISRSVRRTQRERQLAERTAMVEREFPAEQRPAALALAQIAETRDEGKRAVESTPFVIRRAKADGMKPPAIAKLLGVTDSYVYDVLRKPEQPGTPEWFEQFHQQAEREAYERRRAHVPAGRTLYEHRIELFGSSAGDGWQTWGSGDNDAAPGTEAQLAEDLLADAEENDEVVRTHRARVLIWEGPEGTENDALYVHEREPAALPEPEFPVDEHKTSTRSDDQQ
ncbi:hypothetical protein [Streptomyces sp. Agncl-13]|uniref:hypothetical protein n=1 Tax=Streptomyces sp. Agncl-13 TaxID=3400628 RepID=UPI003A8C6B13